MGNISLRSYFHEIEGLIGKGQIEEAEAHCRHILQSFPKLLAAYRLMGKALLEARQYSDAADIFQRVLSSTPDDFISQVGMSIIREDEGMLDAAIWHMERAFEVQPYNIAIQDELRRLYGRRDGVEPPKVRLTRGALARMYAKGNLYQQAIAELRAGLLEETTRVAGGTGAHVFSVQSANRGGRYVRRAAQETSLLPGSKPHPFHYPPRNRSERRYQDISATSAGT